MRYLLKGMDRFKRQALYSWAFVALLAGLSVMLAILQYRWIGEVSRAEQERLKTNLETTLERLRDEFNGNILQAANALTLVGGDIPAESAEREKIYVQKFKRWRDGSHQERLFASLVRIIPDKDGTVTLRVLDQQRLSFRAMEWPANWSHLRGEIVAQLAIGDEGHRRPPSTGELDALLIPLFDDRRPMPLEWVAFEVDLNYVRSALMPELMDRLTRAVGSGYDAELVSRTDATSIIYQSDPDRAERIGAGADAQVGLFDMRWLLSVRHHAGSLDAVVSRTRLKNIAVTSAVLALMLITIAALVRFTRRAQALSQLQLQFVAGVSHELRTPLTVIRTAAHNLTNGVVKSGDVNHVQRYGRLIGSQTEKLTALVEQVLGFANSESGRVIARREQVSVESLIEQAMTDCGTILTESRCAIESHVAADVAPLFGDPTALRHAMQNLLTNAAKYGAEGQWIGVSASMAKSSKNKPMVEIRVSDRGAGIPVEERGQIFEPFYRGRRAIDDQVHGTGLGLALVKRIVEAHGGTIDMRPGPDQRGTEFTLHIPPAPPERIDEFADITS